MQSPYTGALVIQLNDIEGSPAEVISSVLAELIGNFGSVFISELTFTFDASDSTGPAMTVDGPSNEIDRLFGYAGECYPRLAAEYQQL